MPMLLMWPLLFVLLLRLLLPTHPLRLPLVVSLLRLAQYVLLLPPLMLPTLLLRLPLFVLLL